MYTLNTIFSFKMYRFSLGPFVIQHAPLSLWQLESKLGAAVVAPIIYTSKRLIWKLLLSHYERLVNDFAIYTPILRAKWFRFVLFAGLGYKRRFLSQKKIMFTYIGDRHWILYKFDPFSTVVPTKKRNFIFFSTSKNSFAVDYNFFSSLRKPYVYKMKGFLDRRVRRRFLFVRRIKIRGLKMKLSKKQLML